MMAVKKTGKSTGKKRAKKVKPMQPGTLRIRARGLQVVERTARSWKKSQRRFPEAMTVIGLFRAHNNFSFLIDAKDSRFLKGQLSPEGRCQGTRINILPDGRRLDKAYSLFADQLTMHDETSNDHWDVLYRNPGGTYSYVYTLEKKAKATKRKYDTIKEFDRLYKKLESNVVKALNDRQDAFAVPMLTLMRTYMRVGNELYYKAHGHKGLTTLKKSDIRIKGRKVTFKYTGKDGVPRLITEEFPDAYVRRLKQMLRPLKPSSFVFVSRSSGHPLRDTDFEKAFQRYCGRKFYPQIVRAHYATKAALAYARTHRNITKKDARTLFLSIAEKLGHRRFSKKDGLWKDSYNVTTHYYIRPDVVEKINGLVRK